MPYIPIKYIVPFSLRVKSIFDANKVGIVAFQAALGGTWEADEWVPEIEAADGIINPDTYTKSTKGNVKKQRKYMKKLSWMLANLKYYIELGLKDGTITDSLQSFRLVAFNKSINGKRIIMFHNCYVTTIAKVNSNQIALTALGWMVADTNGITINHDAAWKLSNINISNTVSRANLSKKNLAIMNKVVKTDKMILNTARAFARKTGNDKLLKMCTEAAVLRSVKSTKVKKKRNKEIGPTQYSIYQTDFVWSKTIKGKVLSKKSLFILQTDSKKGPYEGGMELMAGVGFAIQRKMIPGKGKYIVIYNPDTNVKGVIELLIIKGGKARGGK